nr:MAG TPA: hypothetical protein [Caudoviricetes sp.]
MEGRYFFNAYYIACGKIYRLVLRASALARVEWLPIQT